MRKILQNTERDELYFMLTDLEDHNRICLEKGKSLQFAVVRGVL